MKFTQMKCTAQFQNIFIPSERNPVPVNRSPQFLSPLSSLAASN